MEKLFGSSARLKVMRLFLLNPGQVFDAADVERRTKISRGVARKEIRACEDAGLIKARSFFKLRKGKKKARVPGWTINEEFPALLPLKNLIAQRGALDAGEIVRRLRAGGALKLVVLSGLFVKEGEGRVDLLVVGDKLKKSILERALRSLEAEVGTELSYAFLETNDFLYRLSVCDRFVSDILHDPHEKVFNKLGDITA